jgi:hypothetical protein
VPPPNREVKPRAGEPLGRIIHGISDPGLARRATVSVWANRVACEIIA